MTTAKENRTLHAAQMRVHFAQEGGIADPEKEALLERFIDGTASLADIFKQANT